MSTLRFYCNIHIEDYNARTLNTTVPTQDYCKGYPSPMFSDLIQAQPLLRIDSVGQSSVGRAGIWHRFASVWSSSPPIPTLRIARRHASGARTSSPRAPAGSTAGVYGAAAGPGSRHACQRHPAHLLFPEREGDCRRMGEALRQKAGEELLAQHDHEGGGLRGDSRGGKMSNLSSGQRLSINYGGLLAKIIACAKNEHGRRVV